MPSPGVPPLVVVEWTPEKRRSIHHQALKVGRPLGTHGIPKVHHNTEPTQRLGVAIKRAGGSKRKHTFEYFSFGLDVYRPLLLLEGVASWQDLFGEHKVLVRLVLSCHPRSYTLVEEVILRIEGFKLWIFSGPYLL